MALTKVLQLNIEAPVLQVASRHANRSWAGPHKNT